MEIISLILIGLSLSVDAFTLSLSYGLLNVSKKSIISSSLSVGLFHFFMPLLGIYVGNLINGIINGNYKVVLLIVLIIILIEMIKSLKEEIEEKPLNLINILLFSLFVSFDSFSIGVGLKFITDKLLLSSIIFSIISSISTFLGFTLGKYLNKVYAHKSKIIGIILLIFTIIYFLLK